MQYDRSALLGNTIERVRMPDDEHLLFDMVDGRNIQWQTTYHDHSVWEEGDSEQDNVGECWIESIIGLGYLKNGRIIQIIPRNIPSVIINQLKQTRGEYDGLFGVTLVVEIRSYEGEGRYERVDIEFRNSGPNSYGGDFEESVLDPVVKKKRKDPTIQVGSV